MADKSIYFTTPGEYNSTYFRNHQQLFSIGSTAGFHHNYIRANDKNYKVSFTHENVEHIYSPNARFSAVIKASDLTDISKEIKVKALNGKDTVKIKQSILAEIKSLLEKTRKKSCFILLTEMRFLLESLKDHTKFLIKKKNLSQL